MIPSAAISVYSKMDAPFAVQIVGNKYALLAYRGRENMAHARQSKPYYGPGFQVKVLETS